jgi:SseB protein N-terminal domain
MRLPGTTPAAPDDDGKADPALIAALAVGDPTRTRVVILQVRLLVPVVAMPSDAGDAEMAVPALVAADGRRALPVFSSYDALRAWRADARPVPMPGARVIAGAVAERYDGVVLDVAGPVQHTVDGVDLQALAEAATALMSNPDARIAPLD